MKVILTARDNGVPVRSGLVTVTVIIEKDPNQLVCGQNPFTFSTSENRLVNTVIGTVNAGQGVRHCLDRFNPFPAVRVWYGIIGKVLLICEEDATSCVL